MKKIIKRVKFMQLVASYLQLFSFFGFVCSIIAWPFYGWSIAWRMGLASLIGIVLFAMVYNGLKQHIEKIQP